MGPESAYMQRLTLFCFKLYMPRGVYIYTEYDRIEYSIIIPRNCQYKLIDKGIKTQGVCISSCSQNVSNAKKLIKITFVENIWANIFSNKANNGILEIYQRTHP